jgi:hypothetical protein
MPHPDPWLAPGTVPTGSAPTDPDAELTRILMAHLNKPGVVQQQSLIWLAGGGLLFAALSAASAVWMAVASGPQASGQAADAMRLAQYAIESGARPEIKLSCSSVFSGSCEGFGGGLPATAGSADRAPAVQAAAPVPAQPLSVVSGATGQEIFRSEAGGRVVLLANCQIEDGRLGGQDCRAAVGVVSTGPDGTASLKFVEPPTPQTQNKNKSLMEAGAIWPQ